MDLDVAIIGAGMSGLAAAIRLAHFGKKVCIFERHSVWGGLNSFYKKGGHHFDTGLHAVTNYISPDYRGPRVPLQLISRQLRIPIQDFALRPQNYSQTVFDSVTLRWENGLERITSEISEQFPDQIDGWTRLAEACRDYPPALENRPFQSTRARLKDYISDPLLTDIILCPLLYYGSAVENDVDFSQFITLFNSIYREGFGRPDQGVKHILNLLLKRLKETGGEMRRRCGVQEIQVENGRVKQLILDDGEVVSAKVVLSSAGLVETERMRTDRNAEASQADLGTLAFVENIFVLDCAPKTLGVDASISFFNHSDRFVWNQSADYVDFSSGVLCLPDNYLWEEAPAEHHLRITHLANWKKWFALDSDVYQETKQALIEESKKSVASLVGDFSKHLVYVDGFSPTTVKKFTGHLRGAIYGSPNKRTDGKTDLDNLFLCGTDQGMLGIIGAMVSGVAVANAYGMDS